MLAAALQKKNARKRRGGPGGGSLSMSRDASLDEEITPVTPGLSSGDLGSIPNTPITPNVPSTPRMTGSLAVPGHGPDDIITRMKNIELIELGRHRIKPW